MKSGHWPRQAVRATVESRARQKYICPLFTPCIHRGYSRRGGLARRWSSARWVTYIALRYLIKTMRKNFLQIVLVLIQIISSLVFFVASWKADRALDKSGIGDIERFTYWNALAGNYIKLFFLAWVITLFIVISIDVQKHSFINILKTKLPYYVILPPLAILAFCIISIL